MIGSKYDHLGDKAIELRKSGKLEREIAIDLDINPNAVHYILKRFGSDTIVPIEPSNLTNYSSIDPLWFAEFRGFFYGEGCVYIRSQSYKSRNRKSLAPVLEIGLRKDDSALLSDIHATLGGFFLSKKAHGRTNEAVQWSLVGWSNVYSVLPYLLDSKFPSRKIEQLETMKSACEARFTMSYNLNLEEYQVILEYHLKLRNLKLLKS